MASIVGRWYARGLLGSKDSSIAWAAIATLLGCHQNGLGSIANARIEAWEFILNGKTVLAKSVQLEKKEERLIRY